MKIKVYSFPDEMILEKDIEFLFSSSYQYNEKLINFILARDKNNLSGYTLYWLRNLDSNVYIKHELDLREAGYVITALLERVQDLTKKLRDSERAGEFYFSALLSK